MTKEVVEKVIEEKKNPSGQIWAEVTGMTA